MVEYTLSLDNIFGSLADPIRRDILKRLELEELTVTEIAEPYQVSLAAVSKHLKVLERAKLIIRRKRGKEHIIQLSPAGLKDATEYLQYYKQFWESNLGSLEEFFKKGELK